MLHDCNMSGMGEAPRQCTRASNSSKQVNKLQDNNDYFISDMRAK